MKIVIIALSLSIATSSAWGTQDEHVKSATAFNQELERMYSEDQSDRSPQNGSSIDWKVVKPRDEVRHRRVIEMIASGELKSGKDFFHAAMILQHGDGPDDFLLSHELCVTAVFAHSDESGDWVRGAKWLAAASEDRFLESIGRKQRFGTQYKTIDPDPQWHLDPVEEGVTDAIRQSWNVPPLSEEKKRETEMNRSVQK
jgi:hypothetical protein